MSWLRTLIISALLCCGTPGFASDIVMDSAFSGVERRENEAAIAFAKRAMPELKAILEDPRFEVRLLRGNRNEPLDESSDRYLVSQGQKPKGPAPYGADLAKKIGNVITLGTTNSYRDPSTRRWIMVTMIHPVVYEESVWPKSYIAVSHELAHVIMDGLSIKKVLAGRKIPAFSSLQNEIDTAEFTVLRLRKLTQDSQYRESLVEQLGETDTRSFLKKIELFLLKEEGRIATLKSPDPLKQPF